jgi:hypothetical protein
MRDMDRRDFLRTGAFAFLGLAVACNNKKGLVPGKATLDDVIANRMQTLTIIGAGTELLSGKEQRIAFGILDAATNERIVGATGDVWIAKARTEPALGPFTMTYHGDGLGEKGVYEFYATLPTDGQWLAVIEANPPGGGKQRIGGTTFQAGRVNDMPVPGDPAISVATPTFANHRGVEPICTAKPPCSMHAVSLDAALKSHKATVLIIATPAFCQSALCGPEVELVDEMAKEFGARANFIHVEVYKDNKPATVQRQLLSPAAAAWKLDQEPATYFIDTAGVVRERVLGPVDRADIRAFTEKLLQV